jgi:hypoxanthine-DNA glycosylase
VLVLGTVPSVASLAVGQYFANPRNAFWPIVEALLADGERLDYVSRARLAISARIAVWDVLHSAVRPGSLDAAIVDATAVPNDIVGFVSAHPELRVIALNGAKAEALFTRHIRPTLPTTRELDVRRMPSTSPANATVPFADKLAAWREVVAPSGGCR